MFARKADKKQQRVRYAFGLFSFLLTCSGVASTRENSKRRKSGLYYLKTQIANTATGDHEHQISVSQNPSLRHDNSHALNSYFIKKKSLENAGLHKHKLGFPAAVLLRSVNVPTYL